MGDAKEETTSGSAGKISAQLIPPKLCTPVHRDWLAEPSLGCPPLQYRRPELVDQHKAPRTARASPKVLAPGCSVPFCCTKRLRPFRRYLSALEAGRKSSFLPKRPAIPLAPFPLRNLRGLPPRSTRQVDRRPFSLG